MFIKQLNQIKKMEKTILYSKKAHSLYLNIQQYQNCQHEHCKELVKHVKYLSNILTDKALKQEKIKQLKINKNIFRQKENIQSDPQHTLPTKELNRTLEEEIQSIQKAYLKIRKQLNQIESENDELFQENQLLKNKLQKIQQTHSKLKSNQAKSYDETSKSTFQLSLSKCNESVGNNCKGGFFAFDNQMNFSNVCQNNVYAQNEENKIEINLKLATLESHGRLNSTDRSDIHVRYERLLEDFKTIESTVEKRAEEKLRDAQQKNRRLQYQNMQLKKIIKLRNDLQSTRHQTIRNLRGVLDDIGV